MKTLETLTRNRGLAFALDATSATCRVAASARPSRLQSAKLPVKSAENDAAKPLSHPSCADLGSACSPSQSRIAGRPPNKR